MSNVAHVLPKAFKEKSSYKCAVDLQGWLSMDTSTTRFPSFQSKSVLLNASPAVTCKLSHRCIWDNANSQVHIHIFSIQHMHIASIDTVRGKFLVGKFLTRLYSRLNSVANPGTGALLRALRTPCGLMFRLTLSPGCHGEGCRFSVCQPGAITGSDNPCQAAR